MMDDETQKQEQIAKSDGESDTVNTMYRCVITECWICYNKLHFIHIIAS